MWDPALLGLDVLDPLRLSCGRLVLALAEALLLAAHRDGAGHHGQQKAADLRRAKAASGGAAVMHLGPHLIFWILPWMASRRAASSLSWLPSRSESWRTFSSSFVELAASSWLAAAIFRIPFVFSVAIS